jgi:hypothetical protein
MSQPPQPVQYAFPQGPATGGLTKREYIATIILAAEIGPHPAPSTESVIPDAVKHADMLLAELSKTNP